MKTLFEQSCPGRVGVIPRKPGKRASDMLSASLLRSLLAKASFFTIL